MRYLTPTPHRRLLASVLTATLALGAAVSAFAQAPDANSTFTFGGDFRLRNEYYNAASSLNAKAPLHEQDYFRYRLRLWADSKVSDDSRVYFRLAAEPRSWYKETSGKAYTGNGMEWKYALVDNLYFQKKADILDAPTTITIGRQDIQIGETGQYWLVNEGTPGDGSWTWFFDAARFQVDVKGLKSKFDLVLLKNRMDVNGNLPAIGGISRYYINDQDENGIILNVTNKSIEGITLDTLLAYKRDRQGGANSPTSDIYTGSLRVSGKPATGWSYFVEGAYQWGTKKDPLVRTPVTYRYSRDIKAFGFVSRLTKTLDDPAKTQLAISAELLSGDDPSTLDKEEAFDLLWGRYPRFSEVYGFATSQEYGRTNSFTNMKRVGLHMTMTPIKDTTVAFNLQFLMSDQKVPTRASATAAKTLFSQSSDVRGQLYQLKITRKFNKQLSGYILGEIVDQGGYYAKKDIMSFARCELLYSF